MVGIDPCVQGKRDHDERDTGVDGLLKRLEVRVVRPRHSIDHASGEVRVAPNAAQSGEVLRARRHARLLDPAKERHAVSRHRLGIVPELALQRPDRRVLRVGARRNHVHDRCQVEVDTASQQRSPPDGSI